jgi:hypothetical protein
MSTKKGDSPEIVRAWIRNWITANGPTRMKRIRDSSPPRIRAQLPATLYNMWADKSLSRVVDGQYRGKPVYLFMLPTDGRAVRSELPKVFNAERTLLQFQCVAREQLGVKLYYVDRLKLNQQMEVAA